jgi:3-hydroxybenzoate 6-monooxygenase
MVTGFEEHGAGVVVRTEDGRSFEGAAVVGSDGLRSRVRAQLLADGDPHPIGYVAHRTIVPMAELSADVRRSDVVLWGGPGFHIVHYPLRHGELFNIVAVFRTSSYLEKGGVESYRAELCERSEQDIYQCLAWRYDGFAFPDDAAATLKRGSSA